MKVLVEFTLAAGVAAGLHLVFLAQLPGGAEGAGDGGAALTSLAPADAGLAALVAEWDRPPDMAEPAAPASQQFAALAPEVPRPATPVEATAAPATLAPVVQPEAAPTATAPPPPEPAPDVPDAVPLASLPLPMDGGRQGGLPASAPAPSALSSPRRMPRSRRLHPRHWPKHCR
jgi:protein TonB